MSHSPFAYNWQNKFWDSKPIVACFPSNKGGNLDIRIPRNFSELYPTSCMRDVCRVRGLGSSCMLKQNIFSYSFDFVSEAHKSKDGCSFDFVSEAHKSKDGFL